MVISFANHKGGTGKTTSVINIGRVLALQSKKVLLIDLDPQGNLSFSLGVEKEAYSVADFLLGSVPFEQVACESNGMHILPADMNLYEKGKRLEALPDSAFRLKSSLSSILSNYDFVLIDCAPTISIFTINALNVSEGAIVPMVFEVLSIKGLGQILEEIEKIKNSTNPNLKVIGALGVAVNESRKLTEEVLSYVRDNYNIPIFNNYIRTSVKVAEAPSFAQAVIDYAPQCNSAKDYKNVTRELLKLI